MLTAPSSSPLIDDYLRLGLAFDRIEEGFVDAFTGDPALRAEVENAPAPHPSELAARARELRSELPGELSPERAAFLDAHLRALECSGRKLAGEDIGFIDEVRAYFDVDIEMGDEATYASAHAEMAEVLEVPGASGQALADAYDAFWRTQQIPADQVSDCVREFSGALRDRVRSMYVLPDHEMVDYEIVTDKPWSGFNYYLGDYRSRVAVNVDLPQYMANIPGLIAHESYPGHHTEHCRKEQILVGSGQLEHTIFVVNTPQCLMAEGLADHALGAVVGADWGVWAQEIFADLGLRFDGERAQRLSRARAGLLAVRQDAAIMLNDRHADVDTVVDFLRRTLLVPAERAQHMVRFLTSPLWRAYISTYVEGYRLLDEWLALAPAPERLARFGRLLDEPLTPSMVRAEIVAGEPAP